MSDPYALVVPGVVFPRPDGQVAREWLTVIHEVARRHGGRVLGDLSEPRVDRNFYAVAVEAHGQTVTLVLNTAAKLVAAVEGDRPYPPTATFIEVPSSEVFRESGFQVVSPVDLAVGWAEPGLQRLSDEEAEQVRYHRPNRVGDVLFNWFD